MNKNVIKPKTSILDFQNCYLKSASPAVVGRSIPASKKYVELEEQMLPNGVKYELVEKEYPFTPEYVRSYADTVDYRRDPMQAIANAPKRANLGDVGAIQQLLNSSSEENFAFLEKLIEARKAVQAAQKQEPGQEPGQESVKE